MNPTQLSKFLEPIVCRFHDHVLDSEATGTLFRTSVAIDEIGERYGCQEHT